MSIFTYGEVLISGTPSVVTGHMHLNFLPPQVINVFANVNGMKRDLRLGFTSASSLSAVTVPAEEARSLAYIAAARGDAGPCDGGRAEGEKLSADLRTVELTLHSERLRAPFPPPTPALSLRAPARPPPAFPARGREAVLQTGVGLKARPPSSSRLRARAARSPFSSNRGGVGLRGLGSVFRDFFPAPRTENVCLSEWVPPGARQMSPESSGCAAGCGPARSERGGARALPARLQEWMCHGTKHWAHAPCAPRLARARPGLARARPLTCPRAPPAVHAHRASHLPLAP